ncbi:MAG TPA: RDD family protein, partial [Isosphaeraceae bacterium]|nr:RDD family protein [Isosphaeraceae bacterium]
MSFADQPEINPYAAPKTRPAPFMEVEGQPFIGYAGFWRRVGAYLIDAFLVQIVTFIAAFAAGMLIGIVGAATGNLDMVQKVTGPL